MTSLQTSSQRAVTLPTKLQPQQAPSRDTQPAHLFTHPAATIIKFSAASAGFQISEAGAWNSANQELGILPWSHRNERVEAAGPLHLYRAHGASFINSGKVLISLFRSSQCWCVDGKSKFAMLVQTHIYRIELPCETNEDLQRVEEFKDVLRTVIRYEKTTCPFNRGFTVPLPEQPESPSVRRQRAPVEPARKWQFDDGWRPEGTEKPIRNLRPVRLAGKSPEASDEDSIKNTTTRDRNTQSDDTKPPIRPRRVDVPDVFKKPHLSESAWMNDSGSPSSTAKEPHVEGTWIEEPPMSQNILLKFEKHEPVVAGSLENVPLVERPRAGSSSSPQALEPASLVDITQRGGTEASGATERQPQVELSIVEEPRPLHTPEPAPKAEFERPERLRYFPTPETSTQARLADTDEQNEVQAMSSIRYQSPNTSPATDNGSSSSLTSYHTVDTTQFTTPPSSAPPSPAPTGEESHTTSYEILEGNPTVRRVRAISEQPTTSLLEPRTPTSTRLIRDPYDFTTPTQQRPLEPLTPPTSTDSSNLASDETPTQKSVLRARSRTTLAPHSTVNHFRHPSPSAHGDVTRALVSRTFELLLGPPSGLVAVMMQIANRFRMGAQSGEARAYHFCGIEAGSQLPGRWQDSEDEGWEDSEDDYGVPMGNETPMRIRRRELGKGAT